MRLALLRSLDALMKSPGITLNRRAVLALGAAAAAVPFVARAKENTMSSSQQFWPNNARLAVSFSLMFEAGGQPISGAPGSFGVVSGGIGAPSVGRR